MRQASPPVAPSACQTPSIPRKGTETPGSRPSVGRLATVRHPQFPARGRKQLSPLEQARAAFGQTPSIPRKGTETLYPLWTMASSVSLPVRHPQFPARGRKHNPFDLLADLPSRSDTLNSPQGDGNGTNHLLSQTKIGSQTPSIPRKGTETRE